MSTFIFERIISFNHSHSQKEYFLSYRLYAYSNIELEVHNPIILIQTITFKLEKRKNLSKSLNQTNVIHSYLK